MGNECLTGLYGKLPAHGDFVQRILPTEFVNAWDEWMQHYIAGSQEQIGDTWTELYLTSPIWHFMISDGCIDSKTWCGILLPSVDKVGRYFPLSIVAPLPPQHSALEFVLSANPWFELIEDIALQALEDDLSADDLLNEINKIKITHSDVYKKHQQAANTDPVVIKMDFEEQSPSPISDYMLDTFMQKSFSSYSVWSTKGSEYVAPSVFFTQGLPPIKGIAGMFNGDWTWQQPFEINVS